MILAARLDKLFAAELLEKVLIRRNLDASRIAIRTSNSYSTVYYDVPRAWPSRRYAIAAGAHSTVSRQSPVHLPGRIYAQNRQVAFLKFRIISHFLAHER